MISPSPARRRTTGAGNGNIGSGIAGRTTASSTELTLAELAARARMVAIIKRAAVILVPIIVLLIILSMAGISPVYLGMRATHGMMSVRATFSNVKPVHGVSKKYMAFVNLASYWSSYSTWNNVTIDAASDLEVIDALDQSHHSHIHLSRVSHPAIPSVPFRIKDTITPATVEVQWIVPTEDGIRSTLPYDAIPLQGNDYTIVNRTGAPTMLYFHRGAFITRPTTDAAMHLANRFGMRVLSVHYRLAPKHPLPAAVDDAYIAYNWLQRTAHVAAQNIIVVGDEAGSGLALLLLQWIMSQGETLPAGAFVHDAWTDLTCEGGSMITAPRDLWAPLPVVKRWAKLAVGNKVEVQSLPSVSPLFGAHKGLPPLLFSIGGKSMLLADARRFADNAAHNGGDVTFHVTPGVGYNFHSYSNFFSDGQDEYEMIGRKWLRRVLRMPEPKLQRT